MVRFIGDERVSLTMQTPTRPSQRLAATLLVRDDPPPGGSDDLTITGSTVGAAGEAITMSVTNVPDSADNIRWEFGDASGETTGVSETVQHTYAAAGQYDVTVQARRGSSVLESAQQTVEVSESNGGGGGGSDIFTTRNIAIGGTAVALAIALTS